jgi:SNF family Na+-dependent transporter
VGVSADETGVRAGIKRAADVLMAVLAVSCTYVAFCNLVLKLIFKAA